MKKILAVVVLCIPAFGQAAYSGLGLHSGHGTYVASSISCPAPNFCAYSGVDVIPWGTVPDFGGALNNNTTAYDASYLGHINIDGVTTFGNSAYLSRVTRLTDSSSVPARANVTLTAGQGGSGVFTLTNTNTTLVGVNDNSQEHVCLFNTSGYSGHCLPASAFTGTNKPASGIFITTNMCASGCGSSSSSGTAQDFGAISFSLTDPSVLYTFGNNSYDISTATTVTPYTINTSTGIYTVGSPLVDFQYGLPLGTNNAPAWAPSTSYAYGAYVTHALTSAEMAGSGAWTQNTLYNAGDIIASGGTLNCMYRATVGGTSGSSSPAFVNSGSSCKDDVISKDGAGCPSACVTPVTWRGTNSTPQFVYQNTGSAGTSSSSAFQWVATPATLCTNGSMSSTGTGNTPQVLTCGSSAFSVSHVGQAISVSGAGASGGILYTTILSYTSSTQVTLATKALTTVNCSPSPCATVAITGHPDFFSSTAGDANGIVWTNVGPSYVPQNGNQLWQALGGVSRDTLYSGKASKYGIAISTNTYGVGGSYNKYNADQGTGVWALMYDEVPNIYHLLNTATGIWTDWHCLTPGTGYNCSGGTWSPTTVGTLTTITNPLSSTPAQPCPFYIHNEKMSTNGLYVQIVNQADVYPACSSLQNFLIWQTTASSFNAANSLQFTYAGMNHWAIGTNKIVAFNGSAFGYTAGAFTSVYDASHANAQPTFSVSLKALGNAGTGIAQSNPQGCFVSVGSTTENPDCNLSEVLDSHLSWVGDPGTDTYPVCGTSYNYATLGPAFNAWQNMETCYQTYPTYSNSALPSTNGSVWQFTHTFATGTNLAFSTQFQISEYSQDANWLFWSSDWNCQDGSTTGSAPVVYSGSGTYYQMLAITPVPASPTSLCGLPWAASASYVAGNLTNPIEGTGGSAQVDDVFQALTSGTTGSTQPGPALPNSYFSTSTPPSVSPVAITAATESGATATITSNLNPAVGVQVNISGVTPSGYNGNWLVTASGLTSFQFTNTASGLGNGTAFGTASAAGSTICDSPTAASVNPLPPYSTSCPGGVVWQDLGPQDQRGDVFAVNLGNQH